MDAFYFLAGCPGPPPAAPAAVQTSRTRVSLRSLSVDLAEAALQLSLLDVPDRRQLHLPPP